MEESDCKYVFVKGIYKGTMCGRVVYSSGFCRNCIKKSSAQSQIKLGGMNTTVNDEQSS